MQIRGKLFLGIWLAGVLTISLFGQRVFDPTKVVPPLDESGFQPIFDGKTLNGWDCDSDFWRAEDGAIVGESKLDHQPKQNIFCIWKGGQPADFELKLQYRLTGTNDGNSGIQYRSIERPDIAKWVMQGYQADIDLKQMFTGQIYEERGRGFLALRGQIAYVPSGKKVGSIGTLGDSNELKGLIKNNDWNDLHIIARGNTIVQSLNGRVMSALIDDDTAGRKMQGEIGIQLHRLPNAAMKIEVRNIRLKTF
jgi:3-keto-disaccharide hydrolase